ncbi:hypothetical protein [Vibrio jasicida]|uniref:hypothetical protein n=1 Tax=Vibrio jasicida TaxID=766224 RepID=UPI0003AAE6AB|nr:hypothetical protein [Vibrio jasicida]
MKFKLLFISTLLLSGCNGGSGGGSSSDSISVDAPEALHIETSPIQSKGLVSEEVAIDVLATNDVNAAMKVTSVRSMSGDSCQVTSFNEQSFTTSSDEVGECQYEYTVAPQNSELYVGEESSIARVSVSETATDNTLPNLAETTDIDTPVVIDLSQELAGELDTSVFYLSSDASVLGAGIVDSDAANNVLTFTPFEVGVSRVTYSMTDGSVTKLGTIDVAVSDTQNTPPVALNYVREGKLDKGMLVTIDLTDYISDAEDAVILESVRAYNAETEITSASEHTFTFRSSEPGTHEVAYTINDGRGGYAVGQVYLEVEPDFSLVQDWDDVTVYDSTIGADITFTAPVSKVLADYTNTAYTNYQAQDGVTGPKGTEVVTMNLEQAQNYCAIRNGRLPINREWELLITNQGNLFTSQNWPAGADFWSADMMSETTGKGFDTTSGNTSELTKSTGEGFVTCVLLDNESIIDFSTKIESTPNVNNPSEHSLSLLVSDPDGNLAPFQDLRAEIEQEKGVFSNDLSAIKLVTDSFGGALETYRDTSYDDAVLSTLVSSDSIDAIVIKSEITNLISFDNQKPNFELVTDETNQCDETILVMGEFDTSYQSEDYGMTIMTTFDVYTSTNDAPSESDVVDYKASVVHNCGAREGNSYLEFFGHDGGTKTYQGWVPSVNFSLNPDVDYSSFSKVKISFLFRLSSEAFENLSDLDLNEKVAVYAGVAEEVGHFGFNGAQSLGLGGANDFGFHYIYHEFDVLTDGSAESIEFMPPDENGWRKGSAIVPISDADKFARVQVFIDSRPSKPRAIQVDDIQVIPVFD